MRLMVFLDVLSNNPPPGMDEVDYRELATNVLDYKTFDTWTAGFESHSTRPPAYPLMIAATYALSGNRGGIPPRILNFSLDIFSIFLMFLLGRIIAGTYAGLLTAGIYSVFGHAPYYASMVGPHTFSVTLVLLIALALISFRHRYYTILPGFTILSAILIHLRPVFILVAPLIIPVLYLILQGTPRRKTSDKTEKQRFWNKKTVKIILPIFLVATLCAPWAIRNYRIHKELIPVCTIAGWHLGGTSVFDTELPVDSLMENIYSPEHKGFSEADYYTLARKMFFNALRQHPLLIPAFGAARLVIGWSPPGPWWRFALPKAYVFPIRTSYHIILPFLDFEGLLYIFAFVLLAGAILSRKQIPLAMRTTCGAAWPIAVLISAYAAAHIIGFPLPTYRFIIEPLIILLGCVALTHIALELAKTRAWNSEIWKSIAKGTKPHTQTASMETKVVNGAAAFFALLIIIPFLAHGDPNPTDYPEHLPSPPMKNYAELRNIQWKRGGDIPAGTQAEISGVVRYLSPGYKHSLDDFFPVEDNDSVAARLFVEYASPKHPLGIGDVKVNFKKGDAPKEGDPVTLEGHVSSGAFKWIVIDPEKWTDISNFRK